MSSSRGISLPAITAESGLHQPINASSAFFGSAHKPTDATETTINAARIRTSDSPTKVNDLGVPTRTNVTCKHKLERNLAHFQSTKKSRSAPRTDLRIQRTLS